MGIRVQLVFAVEETADEAISGSFSVHDFKIDGVPDDDTDLEVLSRLL